MIPAIIEIVWMDAITCSSQCATDQRLLSCSLPIGHLSKLIDKTYTNFQIQLAYRIFGR